MGTIAREAQSQPTSLRMDDIHSAWGERRVGMESCVRGQARRGADAVREVAADISINVNQEVGRERV